MIVRSNPDLGNTSSSTQIRSINEFTENFIGLDGSGPSFFTTTIEISKNYFVALSKEDIYFLLGRKPSIH